MADGAYELAEWHDLFVAAAGAAAALSGLIFVAVSINLHAILAEEKKIGNSYLTGRALESLVALLVVLGVGIVGLDPVIGRVMFAAVLVFCALGSGVSPVLAVNAYRKSRVKPVAFNLRMSLALLLMAAYAVAGVTLVTQAGGGLHWLLVAFVLAVSIAASNAWVLLVEVLR
jgi:hypothetical protein